MNILQKLENGISWIFERNEYLDLVKRDEIRTYNMRILKKLRKKIRS